MAKESLPKLTEAQVRKLATAQSFERDQRYLKDGAIIEPLMQGSALRAQCAGSDYEPYELSVTFDKNGVAEMDCTCAYDQGGACKHLVALLLTCVHQPQAVRRLNSLDRMLAEHNKEDLIEIIRELKLLRQTAAQMAKTGDWLNVGTIYYNDRDHYRVPAVARRDKVNPIYS
jgi:uncharacterized Zn finger protein